MAHDFYSYTIDVEVTDIDYIVAMATALLMREDDFTREDANLVLYNNGEPDVIAAISVVLGPTKSPVGTQIHGAYCEGIDSDDWVEKED